MENVQYRDLSLMVPNPKNPRKWKNDSEIKNLAESIRKNPDFFEARPILWSDRTGVLMIIGGERRWEAARHLGLTQAPSYLFHNLTEEREDEIMNRDNVHSGVWDEAKLQSWNKEQLQSWGVDGVKWPKLSGGGIQEKTKPGQKVIKRVSVGDVWKLGKSRLVCGDSTIKTDVQKLFEGEQPFCIITDPPYCSGGFQESGKKSGSIGTRETITIANDTLSTRGYMALIKKVLSVAGDVAIAYIFTDWRMFINLFDVAEGCGFGVRNMIVWDKGTPGMGVGWRSQHEIVLMASRSAIKFNPHKACGNVIQCQRTGNMWHPTEKPVELISKIVDITDIAKIIYDPFGGSGTTLIACESLGRQCFIMELDPHYCDVILERWEQFTGQKAEKIN